MLKTSGSVCAVLSLGPSAEGVAERIQDRCHSCQGVVLRLVSGAGLAAAV